ncbi:HAD family hydrolase [Planococcus salinarum]|uniref:HAD family hydrolase n=1 Tax=Planococcus salinarum TaxID=622695 RepID=UPI000E3B90AC|nr:HAD family hydrolase [Planococcus salinarum]TAA73324.1 HAD family hydrolase [Planococcus salinarum]
MIQSVIFDLDGTLLDRDKSLEAFVFHQHKRLRIHLGHIDQPHYIARFLELDQHGYVWKDKVYRQLIEEFGIKGITPEQLLADYLAFFPHHCVPFPGLVSMLDKLKNEGLLVGMITNGYTGFQESNIRALDIEDYFDATLISEKENLRKPDKRIFERALQRLGVTAESALFVGDHPVNDVEAAKQAGMIGVWKRNSQWYTAAADYVIDDLEEIHGLLEALQREADVAGIKKEDC